MNEKLLEYCKQKIDSLLKNKLIRPSKPPWSCDVFYVQKIKYYNGLDTLYLVGKCPKFLISKNSFL